MRGDALGEVIAGVHAAPCRADTPPAPASDSLPRYVGAQRRTGGAGGAMGFWRARQRVGYQLPHFTIMSRWNRAFQAMAVLQALLAAQRQGPLPLARHEQAAGPVRVRAQPRDTARYRRGLRLAPARNESISLRVRPF